MLSILETKLIKHKKVDNRSKIGAILIRGYFDRIKK